MAKRRIGIFLFGEVEVLDLAGPFEVFAISEDEAGERLFDVRLIAEDAEPVRGRNGFAVVPHETFESHGKLDVLVIPGGYGAEEIEIHNDTTIEWIRRAAADTAVTASVCTGALLLAKAGLLNGREATTHWMDTDRLARDFPSVSVLERVRYVDGGDIVTSAGISAGIDMSLHLVERLYGEEAARRTAKRMEYERIGATPE